MTAAVSRLCVRRTLCSLGSGGRVYFASPPLLSSRPQLLIFPPTASLLPSAKQSGILTMSQRAGVNANAARYPRQRVRLPHPRSRSGCLVCRRQHKKCDERRPVCSRCALKGHTCQWPGTALREPERNRTRPIIDDASSIQDSPYDPSRSREETLPLPSTSNEIAGPSGEDPRPSTPLGCSLGPVSSMFLAHFVAETSRFMTIVSPEKNPFLTHMLPMAFSDELILHSLLALGGAHLERKQSSPEINTWVCRHYGRVLYQLQDIISRKSSEPIQWPRALLALLILYVIGVCQFLARWTLWNPGESGTISYGSRKRDTCY